MMKNPVRNLVSVTAATPEAIATARAAVLELARAKDPEGAAEDAAGRVTFTVEWEPAFKDVKSVSTKHPDATLTLYGEAFAKQNWVSKAVYQAGKTLEDATLSRIDGAAFRQVYREIFDSPFVEPPPAATRQ